MVKKLCPDKRVTKTKALIEAAYLASLKEVGYKKTTVKEICDRAYISRKTFYCHYETIDFLFEELMDRCFQHQSLELSIKIHEAQVKYYFTDYPKYEQIVFELFCESNRIIAENRDTLKIFFETEDPFVEKYIRTRCISSQLLITNHCPSKCVMKSSAQKNTLFLNTRCSTRKCRLRILPAFKCVQSRLTFISCIQIP